MLQNVRSVCFSIVPVLIFASYLSLAPRHFHDLHLYQKAVSDWEAGKPVYERFLTTSDPTGGEFAYPPLFLLVFYPFSKLSSYSLVLVWDGLNLLFLFASLVLLGKCLLPEKKGFFYLNTLSVLLFSFPVLFTFQLGQTSLWALFALSLTLYLAEQKKERFASLSLLLVSFLKFFPAVFFLPFLGVRKKPFWTAFLFFFLLLLFVTLFLFPEETHAFVFQVLPRRAAPAASPANQSVDAFLVRAFAGSKTLPPIFHAPSFFPVLSVILKTIGSALLLLFLLKRNNALSEKLVFTLFTFFLFFPIVWIHYYVLLLPVCLWFTKHKKDFQKRQRVFISACFGMLYFSFICFSSSGLPFPFNILLMSIPLYAVTILYVIFIQHHGTKKEDYGTA